MVLKFPAEIFGETFPGDDTEEIYRQAWFTLVQIRKLFELNSKVSYFTEELDGQLRRTAQSLEHIFPRPEEEPDIAF